MNEEEKKAIDFLKETNFDYLDYDMCVSSVETISNLVERLQKENEELKKSEIIYERVRGIQEKNKNIVDNKYIPIQKIIDKIEKLEIEEEKYRGTKYFNTRIRIENEIQVLQELLEK